MKVADLLRSKAHRRHGWAVKVGLHRLWFDDHVWGAIPEGEKIDFLAGILGERVNAYSATAGLRIELPGEPLDSVEREIAAAEEREGLPRHAIRGHDAAEEREGTPRLLTPFELGEYAFNSDRGSNPFHPKDERHNFQEWEDGYKAAADRFPSVPRGAVR